MTTCNHQKSYLSIRTFSQVNPYWIAKTFISETRGSEVKFYIEHAMDEAYLNIFVSGTIEAIIFGLGVYHL